jgi:hypothetical protein
MNTGENIRRIMIAMLIGFTELGTEANKKPLLLVVNNTEKVPDEGPPARTTATGSQE